MRSVIFTMSVSGSVMLIVCCLVCGLCGSRLREKWKRRWLFLVMTFYLVPFAAFKPQICEWINSCYPGLLPRIELERRLDKSYAVTMMGDRYIALGNQRCLEKVLLISAAITVIIISCQIYRCWTLKKNMKTYKRQSISKEQQQIFEHAMHELHIKRRVEVCQSPNVPVPSATGIFKIRIWLPEDADAYSVDELEAVFKHELAHFKHYDLLIYVIGMLIVALHWFNPLSYLLFCQLRVNGEQYSDETVVETMADKDKIRYCEMLIRASCRQTKKYGLGLSFAAQSKKRIKRRIDLIMNKKKKNMLIAVTAGLIGSVLSMAVVFAYDAPDTYGYEKSVDTSTVEMLSDTAVEDDYFYLGDDPGEVEHLPYDDFFVDKDGQIFPVGANKDRFTCQHTYASGTRKVHILDGKGGCTVNYYHAKQCTKCGYVVTGELYQSNIYKTCLH